MERGNEMNILILLLSCLLVSACTQFKVVEIGHQTGYLPIQRKADVIKHEKYDLDSMKSLIVVSAGEFFQEQVINMHYFENVISLDELRAIIIQEGLQEEIPCIADKIGINKAYTHYKRFLWLRFDSRRDGMRQYAQLILTDPGTLNDIFITEIYLDIAFRGVSDYTEWCPLCNALLDYIRENSKSYE